MTPELHIDHALIDHVAFGSGPIVIPEKKSWAELSARRGRNDLPAIFVEAYAEEWLREEDFAEGLSDAWTSAEFPGQAMDLKYWLMLFRHAIDDGWYLEEDELATIENLPEVITLWRGAWEEFRDGISWTGDRKQAEWFAHRLDHSGNVGKLYEITVGRELVLAHFTGRKEDEYVVDTDMLYEDDIQEVG